MPTSVRSASRFTALVLTASLAAAAADAASDGEALPGGLPFRRHTTTDAAGRTVTFYLSIADDRAGPLPLVVYCDGSGCQSVFQKLVIDGQDRYSAGLPGLIWSAARRKAHVLVVEKPGVRFLDSPRQPGSAVEGSPEFLEAYTLDSLTEANLAALRAAGKLPAVAPVPTLAIGLSEGGHVAARVASRAEQVTHVAILSCGGATQLFDFVVLQGRPRPGDAAGDAARRIQAVYDAWAKIQADPDSTTLFWQGHPYRRWSTFLQTSIARDLATTRARVFTAHGTEDESVPVESHDLLVAELRAHGRDVTAERLDGMNHVFAPRGAPPGPPDDLRKLLERVVGWFGE